MQVGLRRFLMELLRVELGAGSLELGVTPRSKDELVASILRVDGMPRTRGRDEGLASGTRRYVAPLLILPASFCTKVYAHFVSCSFFTQKWINLYCLKIYTVVIRQHWFIFKLEKQSKCRFFSATFLNEEFYHFIKAKRSGHGLIPLLTSTNAFAASQIIFRGAPKCTRSAD